MGVAVLETDDFIGCHIAFHLRDQRVAVQAEARVLHLPLDLAQALGRVGDKLGFGPI